MQQSSYLAALRILHGPSADIAPQRILSVALRLSRCEAAAVVEICEGRMRVIVNQGFSYTDAQATVEDQFEMAEFLREPRIVKDFQSHIFDMSHPIFKNIGGDSFLISTPISIRVEGLDLFLICLGNRVKKSRPSDLIRWLVTLSDILKDEFELLGELGILSQYDQRNISFNLQLPINNIKTSITPSGIIDKNMRIYAISESMSKILDTSETQAISKKVSDILPSGYTFIEKYIANVPVKNEKSSNIEFFNVTGTHRYTLSSLRFNTNNSRNFYYLITLHRVSIDPGLKSVGGESAPLLISDVESTSVTSEFLLRTIIRQKRLLYRDTTAYHAVARWKKGIKPDQIAALRALKRRPPRGFVDIIAQEMTLAAEALFGKGTIEAVTHVPCGSSGSYCLARLVSERMAEMMGINHVAAFEQLPVRGSSHPIKNGKRPAMKLITKLTCPVLLIDDVATSGSHIEEAARKLRATAPAVLPLVWIAD